MSGADQLFRMAESARALRGLGKRAAESARAPLEEAARASAAAGTTPEGQAWKPTKAGNPPLARAAAAITVRVVGAVLQVIVRGHHFFHQQGLGRSPQRQIIPSAGDSLPASYAAALKGAAVEEFRKAMRR